MNTNWFSSAKVKDFKTKYTSIRQRKHRKRNHSSIKNTNGLSFLVKDRSSH